LTPQALAVVDQRWTYRSAVPHGRTSSAAVDHRGCLVDRESVAAITEHRRGHSPISRDWLVDVLLVILLTMTTLSLAEAKAHLSKLIARVSGQHERVYVTVHGKPSAVLLATEDLESLEETIEILADADAMRRLHASEAELARGEIEGRDELDAAMARRRQRQ
jgi:antitoxin YefM